MFKRTKNFAKRGAASVRRGMGMPIISKTADMIRDLLKFFTGTPEIGTKETFEEAIQRTGLSEEELQEERSGFLKQTLLFLFFAFLILAYAVYLVFHAFFLAGIVTFIMATLLTFLGLRSHFWAFQIQHRKLGCSLTEWLEGKVETLPSVPTTIRKEGDEK